MTLATVIIVNTITTTTAITIVSLSFPPMAPFTNMV